MLIEPGERAVARADRSRGNARQVVFVDETEARERCREVRTAVDQDRPPVISGLQVSLDLRAQVPAEDLRGLPTALFRVWRRQPSACRSSRSRSVPRTRPSAGP